MPIKVYTASKLAEADLWKSLRGEWPEVTFTARWPFFHAGDVPNTPFYAKAFWLQDAEDVKACDVVLVYGTQGEHLRGALVEAGMAIALGLKVIVVGDHPDYGTWQYHPSVFRVPGLEEARTLLKCLAL